MKKLILALFISIASMSAFSADVETKKVCIDQIDKGKPVLDKQGKPKQICKEVKQHKKLDGVKITDAKK